MGSGQWAMGSGQWEMGSGEWGKNKTPHPGPLPLRCAGGEGGRDAHLL